MALGVSTENEIYTVYSIPLEWGRNEIIANHFRMLADSIANERIRIVNMRVNTPINQQFAKPCFEVITVERNLSDRET